MMRQRDISSAVILNGLRIQISPDSEKIEFLPFSADTLFYPRAAQRRPFCSDAAAQKFRAWVERGGSAQGDNLRTLTRIFDENLEEKADEAPVAAAPVAAAAASSRKKSRR
jgi:hypothetical protein